ncbi:MAG: GatB/YqeY domain-containing protein [Verrucomicrobiota bacterium]
MSSLSDQILNDMKSAMKAKDSTALTVLRALKSAIKYTAIEKSGADGELDDQESLAVIRKQIKQREDSIKTFLEGDRKDLAEKEEQEIAVLTKYLPKAMDPSDVAAMVDEVIKEQGATTKAQMGQVMKALQEKAAGAVDNKTLSQEVMKRLQ